MNWASHCLSRLSSDGTDPRNDACPDHLAIVPQDEEVRVVVCPLCLDTVGHRQDEYSTCTLPTRSVDEDRGSRVDALGTLNIGFCITVRPVISEHVAQHPGAGITTQHVVHTARSD